MLTEKRGAEIASESEISPSPATGLSTSVYNDAAIRHEVHLSDILEVQSYDCQIGFSATSKERENGCSEEERCRTAGFDLSCARHGSGSGFRAMEKGRTEST